MASCRDCSWFAPAALYDFAKPWGRCLTPIPIYADAYSTAVYTDEGENCPCHKPIVAVPEKVG